MNIKYEARNLINKYKTNNPFDLIDYLAIILVEKPLRGGLNGCYQEIFGEKIIYINSDLPYEHRLIVAAHELGHAVLHEGENILFLSNNTLAVKERYERQANLFAAELLLDDYIFKEYQGCTLEHISKCSCIPYNLVRYKIKNLDDDTL